MASKNSAAIDEANSDVFLRSVNLDSFNEGKRHNKFDFVIFNWRNRDAYPKYDDMEQYKEFYTYYGRVPVFCVWDFED